jgi:hypothetical protein
VAAEAQPHYIHRNGEVRHYMPAHHDAPDNGVWRAIEPISEALKSENPNIITVSHMAT